MIPSLRYSSHATRRMELRGVTTEEVERVVARGDRVLQSSTGRWAYEAEVNGRWISGICRPNGTIHTVASVAARARSVYSGDHEHHCVDSDI